MKSKVLLAVLSTGALFHTGLALLPVDCPKDNPPGPPMEPADTVFARNLDTYFHILSGSPLFQTLYKELPGGMALLQRILAYIYDPNTMGPSNTLPIIAPTDLYEFVVGLKLHCHKPAVNLLKALVQVDDVQIEVPAPYPDSASTADSHPLGAMIEEEEPNRVELFQYLNDDLGSDFISYLSTLVYQYDQALSVGQEEWPLDYIQKVQTIRTSFAGYRNGFWSIIRKARYAGMNPEMRRREMSEEELRALVDDKALVY